jgi:hypothetical protein
MSVDTRQNGTLQDNGLSITQVDLGHVCNTAIDVFAPSLGQAASQPRSPLPRGSSVIVHISGGSGESDGNRRPHRGGYDRLTNQSCCVRVVPA